MQIEKRAIIYSINNQTYLFDLNGLPYIYFIFFCLRLLTQELAVIEI